MSNPHFILPSQNITLPVFEMQKNKLSSKILYKSAIMNSLLKMTQRVATSNANVLILGESGTGKELIAKSIHERSRRSNRAFVAINCSALRESLLESELFGHEKGAFTGAYFRKIGLAEIASGGTLFLDEIGELSLSIQAKLLRFIQESEIYRVGGKKPIKVDIRLVSATNKNLETEVLKGNFREDLFYRINTIMMNVPPLRRRRDDIPLLVNHFLSQKSHIDNSDNQKQKSLRYGQIMSAEGMRAMIRYDWPGNVRELQNICERLQILAENHVIMPSDLPENILHPDKKIIADDYDPTVTLHDLERRYILKALRYFEGNKTKAAQALGMTIKTLYNRLHEYNEFKNYAVHNRDEIMPMRKARRQQAIKI